MTKTKKWIFSIIAISIAIILIGFLFFNKDESKNLEKETATRGKIKKTISIK